jgi:hypothetical protein
MEKEVRVFASLEVEESLLDESSDYIIVKSGVISNSTGQEILVTLKKSLCMKLLRKENSEKSFNMLELDKQLEILDIS